ncbi:hypothetical protein GCM10028807_61130 [Spirosoma daeguense]
MKQSYALGALLKRAFCIYFFLGLCIVTSVQAQVSGVVFRDFNLNGIRSDTLPIETGISGVTVHAFVDLSKTPIVTVTNSAGEYSFSGADVPAGLPVRIEFTNLPTGYYNGPYGANSSTTVQFAKSPATNVNVGINYPSDYCQSSGVELALPIYVNGNTQITTDKDGNPVPEDRQAARSNTLIRVSYDANGIASPSNYPIGSLAVGQQTGSTWGLAFQRRSKKLYSSAVIKRHMSFGPLGSGGIYTTDIATGITTNFVDLKTIGIDTGDDPHSGLFGDKTQPSVDAGPMEAMGRSSIGGMDLSEDDKTLYLINLKDRKLYGIFIDSPGRTPTAADVKSWNIPDPGCSNGDFRPWAVKFYHGKVYVGVICSAETSQQQADLKATIYRFDPAVANPVFEEIFAFPLDFRRGSADGTFDPLDPDRSCTKYDHWLPWTNAWPETCGLGQNPTFVMFPQPILSSLAFDDDGSMLIGFMDRFGYLAGLVNHDPQGNGLYNGFTGGDLLRAYIHNGDYVLESNGIAGDRTGSGVANNEGPGGGEFYGHDDWFFIRHVAHSEVTNGALVVIPGYNEVVTSAFDPIDNIFQSAGLKVFSNVNGAENRNYVIYTQQVGSFGKAAGLGDTRALCDVAPIEIGNRVWFDDNRDGIQDAYEPGVDGVVLTLHDMENGGALVSTQTTRDGGQFYFNNTNVQGGLKFAHKYEIRMDTVQLPLLDITLESTKPIAQAGGRLGVRAKGARESAVGQRHYSLSPANRSDFTEGNLRDSNAKLVGNSAVIEVTTLDVGQNDFTYDLSMYSCPELSTEKDTIGICPNITIDSISATGNHLSRVDSIRFVVFSSPQSGTAMYGSGGTILGTVKPDTNNRAIIYNPAINTASGAPQYVYAIVFPTPENPACRQTDETVIEIAPNFSLTATAGNLSCSQLYTLLEGQARYTNGTPVTSAQYVWAGPSSFSSNQQNVSVSLAGIYSLTATNLDCPGQTAVTSVTVAADTVKPTLTATGAVKICANCTAYLFADAPGATLLWTGPNGFTSTEAEPPVSVEGIYTVTATAVNRCSISMSVELTPPNSAPPCDDSHCLPITISRIRR